MSHTRRSRISSLFDDSGSSENIKQLSQQMMQLFEIYISQPWCSDEMKYQLEANTNKYRAMLDIVRDVDDGEVKMSMFLTNFIRLLGPNATIQAAQRGEWVDHLDNAVTHRGYFWTFEKYQSVCHVLYEGINQYITNMVSQYKQKYADLDEERSPIWVSKPMRVDINAQLFREVLNTQNLMSQRCRDIYLMSGHRFAHRMDKYIIMILKFMIISTFLLISSSIPDESKQQKSKCIGYEPNIKGAILASTNTMADTPYVSNTDLFYFSPFDRNLLVIENPYDSYNEYCHAEPLPFCSRPPPPLSLEYSHDWLGCSHQTYEHDFTPPISVHPPLNTDPALHPALKSLLDLSTCPASDGTCKTDLSGNDRFYSLLMNKQCLDLVNHAISNNVNHSVFVSNEFHSLFGPNEIPLSKGTQKLLTDVNAGGTSVLSEAFSFQVLQDCLDAKLLKTEMEIKYAWPNGKITDYLVDINGQKVGVSVTRAFKFNGEFRECDAEKLFKKKMAGVIASRLNVQECDQFDRQILHIWTTNDNVVHATEKDVLHKAYRKLLLRNVKLVDNTIVLVTVVSKDMWWLFQEDKYLNKRCSRRKKKKKKRKKRRKGERIQQMKKFIITD